MTDQHSDDAPAPAGHRVPASVVQLMSLRSASPLRRAADSLEAACAEAHVDMQAKYDARNLAALKRLAGGGVQLRAFPHAVAEVAWKTANKLYAELSAKNPRWKKIYGSYAKFRDDEILWFRFAEGRFDNFMASVKR